ncbi:protein TIS11 [Rhopalosiphum maidis]|uniref:protein TIS11 n=1 Tax=Rhopalosiphum maidis TaxID=43146 RepID=UPI000EFDFB41|nr:protein TIS11 [Rhopalosiphum maidis]
MTNSLFNSGETVAKTQNRPRAVATEVEHWWQEMVSSTGSSNSSGSNQGSVSSEPRRRQGQGRRGGNGSGKQQQQQPQQQQLQQDQQQLPPQAPMGSRYKTEMCRQYIEKIKCAYGDKCQFAHGEQDLRPVFRHPKYKTEPCRSFNSAGYCPYGQRCHFVHKGDGYIQPASPASPPLSTSSSSGIGSDGGSLADLGLGMLDSMFTPPQSPEGRLPVFNRLSGSPPATGDVFSFHVPATVIPPSRRLSEPDFGFYGF